MGRGAGRGRVLGFPETRLLFAVLRADRASSRAQGFNRFRVTVVPPWFADIFLVYCCCFLFILVQNPQSKPPTAEYVVVFRLE